MLESVTDPFSDEGRMPTQRILDDDLIRVRPRGTKKSTQRLPTLFWGDTVSIVGEENGQFVVALSRQRFDEETGKTVQEPFEGLLPAKARFRDTGLLKVRFVDVGQGDGAIVDTPGGRRLIIDGGEERHIRNYVAAAYGHLLVDGPLHCDAIVVTHGDADHFSGLTKLVQSSRPDGSPLITADRVFHNGLVKRTADKDIDAFGKVVESDGTTFAVELKNDLTAVPDTQMNTPFRQWKQALKRLQQANSQLQIRRLSYGAQDVFAFLGDEGIKCLVLGPIVDAVNGKPALRFLRTPGSKSLSPSHTINGHSVVLKLSYGNVRFLFGADLNEEAEERLLQRAGAEDISLTAEVLKVPHHGSADFSPRALEAVRPVVSVISSGDESISKEYIHPRAGLVGALGRYSRATVEKPLIYVTEMVAFFERLGDVTAAGNGKLLAGGKSLDGNKIHNAYRKTAFGIVHVRTDGKRVLVVTHSGKDDQKESYAFQVDERGAVEFERKTRII